MCTFVSKLSNIIIWLFLIINSVSFLSLQRKILLRIRTKQLRCLVYIFMDHILKDKCVPFKSKSILSSFTFSLINNEHKLFFLLQIVALEKIKLIFGYYSH